LRRTYLNEYLFHSNSDAEVIPYLYEKFGIEFIHKLRGIFAIAIYDKRSKFLYLVRDRFGVKPIYYTFQKNTCFFSSELKSFTKLPHVPTEIDFERYIEYLGFQFVPGDNTIFKNIYRVTPGSYLEVNDEGHREVKYYNLPTPSPITCDKQNAFLEENIKENLLESLSYRLISDVPIGVLLSGGLDSSSLVSLLSSIGEKNIKTFSVGFGTQSDEFEYARMVADKFKTQHTEILIEAEDIKKYLPKIVLSLDEPLADTGAFASWLIFKHIREKTNIKVALVGEGADEIFAGYSWHCILDFLSWLPESIKNRILFYLTTYSNSKFRSALFENVFLPTFNKFSDSDYLNRVLRMEFANNLPNNLLMKIDKSSMAFGIEAREVYLDHKLVEAVFRFPGAAKVNPSPKFILKDIVKSQLPKKIIQRKKQGFIMPVNHWIHNDLKNDVQERLLSSNSFLAQLFTHKQIENLFKSGLSFMRTSKNALLWRAYLFEIYRQEMTSSR
jgi:asparagine synthase (glutamine-hydrolysing)